MSSRKGLVKIRGSNLISNSSRTNSFLASLKYLCETLHLAEHSLLGDTVSQAVGVLALHGVLMVLVWLLLRPGGNLLFDTSVAFGNFQHFLVNLLDPGDPHQPISQFPRIDTKIITNVNLNLKCELVSINKVRLENVFKNGLFFF